MTEKLNGWARILLAVAAVAIPFLVAWGSLNSRVDNLSERQTALTSVKADRQVVDAQYAAVLRELGDIKQMVRDLQPSRR